MLVDLLSSTTRYTASLVGLDGSVVASVNPAQRTPIATAAGHAIVLPYVSMGSTALYYLNGDSIVESIRPDGAQGAVANLNLGPRMEAAFAVSPDGTRIAVSVLDFNQSPVHVTLYTESLVNTATPRTIYESSSNYVWPVAWHNGLLVLAHGYGPYEEDIARAAPGRDNPYSAISYHVVDPATGNRAVLMGSCTVSGLLSPAGSACIQGGTIDWHGVTTSWGTSNWGSISSAASLRADGTLIAAVSAQDPEHLTFWSPDGTGVAYAAPLGVRDWVGWLGDVVITGSYLDPNWTPELVTVIDGTRRPVAAHGFVAGLVPTNIF